MRNEWTRILTRATDRIGSRARFAVIFTAIVADSILKETPVLGAEIMMLLRWTRDILRYDVRWTFQEKVRLLWTRRPGSMRD
jgi:hypothetical protein